MAREHERDRTVALHALGGPAMRASRQQSRLERWLEGHGARVAERDVLSNRLTAAVPARILKDLAARSDVATVSRASAPNPQAIIERTRGVGAPTWWAAGHIGGRGASDTASADLGILADQWEPTHPALAA